MAFAMEFDDLVAVRPHIVPEANPIKPLFRTGMNFLILMVSAHAPLFSRTIC